MKIYNEVTKENNDTTYSCIYIIPDIYGSLHNGNKRSGFRYTPNTNQIKLRYEEIEKMCSMKEITKENITERQRLKLIKIKNKIIKIIKGEVAINDFPATFIIAFYEEFMKTFNELTNSNEKTEFKNPKLNIYKTENGFFFDIVRYNYSKNFFRSSGINYEKNQFYLNVQDYFYNRKPLEDYEIVFSETIKEIKNKLIEENKKFKDKNNVLKRKEALMIILEQKLNELLEENGV